MNGPCGININYEFETEYVGPMDLPTQGPTGSVEIHKVGRYTKCIYKSPARN